MTIRLNWSPTLARRLLDEIIDGDEKAVNDLSENVRRLRNAEDIDLASPEVFRAFVRGATGSDPALDCTMQRFAYVCAGDEDAFDTDERLSLIIAMTPCPSPEYDELEKQIDAWRGDFNAYHDALAATPEGARAMGVTPPPRLRLVASLPSAH